MVETTYSDLNMTEQAELIEPINKNTSISLAQIYGDHILWELPVQYCASDCVKPGDVVLDVGGHVGGVAIALSRMVAENGQVYTFEPNREMWPHLLENLEINNATNVSHIPLACFSTSGKLMKFYSEPSFYKAGSGLMRVIDGAKSFDVVTIAIDDFCTTNRLLPSFMKIDVEGAEIHVLRSAEKQLNLMRFPIILEYQPTPQPDQNDPLIYLENMGYIFFDVNTYESVNAQSYAAMPDYPLVNVLCVHKDSELATTYSHLIKYTVFDQQILDKDVLLVQDIQLGTGRHIVEIDFDCPDNVTGGLAVRDKAGILAYYEADSTHLRQHCCSCIVIEVKAPKNISVEYIKKGEYQAGLTKVKIDRLDKFKKNGQ